MSAPICPTHGDGFGSPCYLCVDAENRTLRERYAEAVRALEQLRGTTPWWSESGGPAVLSRPEAQAVLKEAPRG